MQKNIFVLLFIFFLSPCIYAQTQGLDSYIQKGLINSPLLLDYQNQIRLNQIDSSVLLAQKKPQVNAIGQVLVAPAYNGYGYDEAVTNTGNYAAQVSVSQIIFAKKIYAPQYEALRIENQSISNTSKISEHDLKKSITDQYLTAYSSLAELSFLKSTYELMQEEKAVLQKFVEQGLSKQTDYLSFEIAIQSEEIQMKQLQNQYRNDLRQLNLICGINDTALYILTSPDIQVQTKIDNNNSLFLKQFKIDSIKINNQKSLAAANYHPKLSWFADAGLLGSNPSLLFKNFGGSFGLNFSVPLFDGRQKNLQYQKITLYESTRSNYQKYYKSQHDLQFDQILSAIIENDQLIAQIRNQLETTETLIKASKQLLNKGELSVTDFIITIKNYIDIKGQLNTTELKKLQLTNELNYWNW